MTKELKIVTGTQRRLGYWETLNALVHDETRGHGTIATVVKIHGQLPANTFKAALQRMFTRHPMLRGTLAKDDDGFYEVILNAEFNNIPIDTVTIDEDEWEQRYQNALYKSFDTSKNLWRATLLQPKEQQHCYIILATSHAVLDGLAAAHLTNELLQVSNQMLTNTFTEPKQLQFLQPIETMLDKSKFEEESIEILSKGETTLKENRERSTWPFQQEDLRLEERKTGSIFTTLESETLEKLQTKCQEKSLTLNDALNAALLLALQQAKQDNGEQKLNTSLCTPIDLRPRCDPKIPTEHLGCNVSMVMTEHSVTSKTNFWDIAQQYHDKVRASISKAGNYPENYKMQDIMPYVNKCKEKREAFFMDFGISNLGKLDFELDKTKTLWPESIYFAASRQAADFAGLLCTATLGDEIFINFTFTEPVFPKEQMEKIADHFDEILEDLFELKNNLKT